MGSLFFLVVFIVPLLIYGLNAFASRRPRGIAGPFERPKAKEARAAKEPRPAKTPAPRRSRARVRPARTTDCGRGWTHLWLSLAGARDSCRYCAALQAAPPAEAAPAPAAASPGPEPIAPDAADAVAEVERMLDDRK